MVHCRMRGQRRRQMNSEELESNISGSHLRAFEICVRQGYQVKSANRGGSYRGYIAKFLSGT